MAPGRILIAVGVASIGLLAAPAFAAATNRYVDADTGADTNTACPLANPCATIAYALANSGTGDPILIDNGTYVEQLTVTGGRSLRFEDFLVGDGTARPVIEGGGGTGITVASGTGTSIYGLTIRGDVNGVLLQAPASIDNSTFDDPDATIAYGVLIDNGGNGSSVTDSTFIDPAPSTTHGHVGVWSNGPATITDNDFTGLNKAIGGGGNFGPGELLIADNEISEIHSAPLAGYGIQVSANPGFHTTVVRGNEITDAANEDVDGITAGAGVQMIRNNISGQRNGIHVGSDYTGVTLEGDRLWGNELSGLNVLDTGLANPVSSVTATNVTAVGNGAGFRLFNANLTLDSSITDVVAAEGTSTCTITYSNGPEYPGENPDTTGCWAFQSHANPLLVNAGTGNLHLQSTSPLIDMGNPAAPAVGAVDFDGNTRALDGADSCVNTAARRDIGADEYSPPSPIDCTAPETTIDSGPADGAFINDATPTFVFSANEAGATFNCSLDGGAFALCSHTTQHIFDLQTDGEHTFAVQATDAALNVDPTPASRTITLDRVAPATTITAKPKRKVTTRTVTVKFNAADAAEFECKLDSKPFKACASPKRFKVKPGRHTIQIRAIDIAGNADATPAKVRFRRVST